MLFFDGGHDLTSDQYGQRWCWEEEVIFGRMPNTVRRDTTSRYQTVEMGVVQELRSPRVPECVNGNETLVCKI